MLRKRLIAVVWGLVWTAGCGVVNEVSCDPFVPDAITVNHFRDGQQQLATQRAIAFLPNDGASVVLFSSSQGIPGIEADTQEVRAGRLS